MRDSYPIPRLDECIDLPWDATVFSTFHCTVAIDKSKLQRRRSKIGVCVRSWIISVYLNSVWTKKPTGYISTPNGRHLPNSIWSSLSCTWIKLWYFQKAWKSISSTWDMFWHYFEILVSVSNWRSANFSPTLSTTWSMISPWRSARFTTHHRRDPWLETFNNSYRATIVPGIVQRLRNCVPNFACITATLNSNCGKANRLISTPPWKSSHSPHKHCHLNGSLHLYWHFQDPQVPKLLNSDACDGKVRYVLLQKQP